MRCGERSAWRQIAAAAQKVADADSFAAEYFAKQELRQAWAKIHGIQHVTGLPRSGNPA